MNITVRQIEFRSTNGTDTIFGWIYIPAGPVRAAVQISHGMVEHMGRYHEFMRWLAQQGYAACGVDHLGHGRSARDDGHLGYFAEQDGWKRLVDDQHKFNKIIRSEVPGAPVVLLGHSMGSFVARLYAAKYPRTIVGLVLCGTARAGVRVDFGRRLAARSIKKNGELYRDHDLQHLVFGHYNDRCIPAVTGYEWLSRNTALVERYADDPRCGYLLTVSGMADMFTLLKKCNENACFAGVDRQTPIYIVAGTMDPVGEYGRGPTQVYDRYVKAGVADVELVLYEGARHEVLGEQGREQILQELLGWLDDHFVPAPEEEEEPDDTET